MATSSLFARKPIADIADEAENSSLPKSIGRLGITALGIGAVIGAGIFVLTGTAAARYAGPGIMLSFVFAGVACVFVALCYAELAALLPTSGSTYTYAYATMGELVAWVIGWDLILEYAAGAATVAVGWSGYAVSLMHGFGVEMPRALTLAPGADGGTLFNLPAAAIILLLTLLLMGGSRESTRVNTIIVLVKLVVVLAFVVVGAMHVHPGNWFPLVPANKGAFGEFGASGLLRGAGVVFYAYIGFDAAATAAAEARDPQRDMPFGIIAALAICTLLYIAVAAVLTGIVPYSKLNVADPIAVATDAIGIAWLSVLVKIGALLGLTTVILVGLFGFARIVLTMAQDGLLPPVFARIHPRWQTPVVTQGLLGLLAALVAGLLPITILSEMVSIGTLFAFILVCAAVIRLRQTDGRLQRPFRVPAMPWVSILGILCCLALMIGLPLTTWLRLVLWMALGVVVYFAYGRSHARLRGLA